MTITISTILISTTGKYIDIFFNSAGNIEGARIEQYLLEKVNLFQLIANKSNEKYIIGLLKYVCFRNFKITPYDDEGSSCSSEPSGAQLPHLLLHASWTLKGQQDLHYCCHHQHHHCHRHEHHHKNDDDHHHHCHNQEQREKLQLREAAHYRYLTGGGSTVCEGRFQNHHHHHRHHHHRHQHHHHHHEEDDDINVTGMTGRNLQQSAQP